MDAGHLSADERELIEHALGLPRAKRPYRVHFAAASGTKDFATCEALAERDMMERGAALDYGRYFFVTEKGARMLGHTLPKD